MEFQRWWVLKSKLLGHESTFHQGKIFKKFLQVMTVRQELGSVAGPVIQANGRLTFEDDLRSGGLLCFISMNASVRTELADSMVTPGEPGGD